jgi:hypothetical protein
MLRREIFTCAVALVATLSAAPLRAQVPASRLRPQNARITAWLADGRARSPTLRALIARIDASDVLVYLDVLPALRPGVSAALTFMGDTPYGRMVRVSIRPALSGREAMAMLAHELQHVVELLEHPEVRSEAAFEALFRRIGRPSTFAERHFDTEAALDTGDRVRHELAS